MNSLIVKFIFALLVVSCLATVSQAGPIAYAACVAACGPFAPLCVALCSPLLLAPTP